MNPISRIVEPVARVAAILCGYAVLVLSVLVAIDIVGRKLFGFTFQGMDDMGGYVLAIIAVVGASYTMAMRGHTRVDVFLVRMPPGVQRVLNTLAMVTMAAFAAYAAWRGLDVLQESIEFQSVASNPLQTPLWQPQGLWVASASCYSRLISAGLRHPRARAPVLRGSPDLNRFYGPSSAQDELEAELTARAEREAQADAKGAT